VLGRVVEGRLRHAQNLADLFRVGHRVKHRHETIFDFALAEGSASCESTCARPIEHQEDVVQTLVRAYR